LYATKQNKTKITTTKHVYGLKIAAKYVCCPAPRWGAYSAPPVTLAGGEEKGKGWEGRGGHERKGDGQGKAGERKGGGERMGPTFWVKFTPVRDDRSKSSKLESSYAMSISDY